MDIICFMYSNFLSKSSKIIGPYLNLRISRTLRQSNESHGKEPTYGDDGLFSQRYKESVGRRVGSIETGNNGPRCGFLRDSGRANLSTLGPGYGTGVTGYFDTTLIVGTRLFL